MQNELDIVRDVSARLESAGFAFMLTGSMAMNDDAERVVRLFTPDYYVSPDAVSSSIRNESMFNLIHQESVIKVDCIVRKQSEYRCAEFERRRRIRVLDFETWIVSKEDLILSKLHWSKDSRSEQQLGDVRNLVLTGCDRAYIERWTMPLGVATLWKEIGA